jgi:hypothetical protein
VSTGFDRGIAVSARPEDPTTYDTELSAGWQIGAGSGSGEVERIRALATYADLGALNTRRHSAG